jgi:hypothetical protein
MKIIRNLIDIINLLVIASAILLSTFGNPTTINNSFAIYAPFICTVIGTSLLITGLYAFFTKKMTFSAEKQQRAICALLFVSGTLLVHVGGRWLWTWFY